jgi:1-deoxy-D-xylulose-5-phosphate synthase
VKLVAIGAFAHLGLGVIEELKSRGVEAELIVPLQVFPIEPDLLSRLKDAEFIFSLEDGIRIGGFGSALALQVQRRVEQFGVINAFPAAAPRAKVLEASGLTVEKIAEKISAQLHK